MTMNEKRRDLIQKYAALGSLAVLILVFSVTAPRFWSVSNALSVALQVCTIAYLGMGMTVVIITGGIDLSVGSVLALGGVMATMLSKAGWPVVPAMTVGLLLGGVAGLANGLLVAQLKLPPFIATLGMMQVARGVILQITGARAIAGLSDSFSALGNDALFKQVTVGADGYPDIKFVGIPYPVIVMIILAILMSIMLSRTRFGRHIYATGSNNEAARLSGVNVYRTTLSAYAIAGLFAGLTGIVLMSRLSTGQPNEGISYELDAIAAAVIGGASLTQGGIGTISGTMIGAFVIGILRNGLNMNGVSSFVQQIIIGLVILLTVWIDQLRTKRSTRVRVFAKEKQVERSGAPAESSEQARRAVE